MSEKCNKYESLFVFSTEEELENHIKLCEDCRNEHEKMRMTADIVKEVAPYYGKNRHNNVIKLAAGIIIIFLAYFILFNENKAYEIDSVISEMGLPTDEYGLLMVY